LVLAARREAAERAEARRRFAADLVWRDIAPCDAAERPSRSSAARVACERRRDTPFFPFLPRARSRFALRRVRAGTVPFSGGGRSTPARRAFDSPMAIACFGERAPCLPSRMCSNSSRTNSPACVLGALPLRRSAASLPRVLRSGMTIFRMEATHNYDAMRRQRTISGAPIRA
jgi:hypothetical protein